MPHLTEELVYWINERERIKLLRATGAPAPWSADPIFQTVRFCNVHREDDTVTKWIRNYWNKAEDPAWKFVLGRMLNLPGSLEACLFAQTETFSLSLAKQNLIERRRDGNKIFTSAYTISTCGKKMDKLDYVFGVVQEVKEMEEFQKDLPSIKSLEKMARWLEQFDGLGSFLAGQVIADMKNTLHHPLQGAPDWWTWSAPGPGSLRGLSWYFYGQPTGATAAHYQKLVQLCYDEVMPHVNPEVGLIHMQDFQNDLCEFSKYMKVKTDPKAHVRNRVEYA